MAVFIDNVVHEHTHRTLTKLGENTLLHEQRILQVMGAFISGKKGSLLESSVQGPAWYKSFMPMPVTLGKPSEQSEEKIKIDEVMHHTVTKKEFNHWLHQDALIELLEECDIETSTRYELFDVLDADMGGALEFQELLTGLMKLRGPITKSDIISISLKVRHLTGMIEDIMTTLVQVDKSVSNFKRSL
eukprot:TRINITY_DN42240_c0_g1_i1.p1 TRINITY_DN42240_c0_g1~~TRINITY_DN42240_c0_g1_i1.p1  ORF type:complete len:216 (+),score=27.34 TRINITY_DN42240_c0_g1_i1:85-648(+)